MNLDMCGASKPMKPIVPVKAVGVAVSRAASTSTIILVVFTFTPRVKATSSPTIMASKFFERTISVLVEAMNTTSVISTSSQLALPRSPKIQKTRAATCSVVPKYWRSDVAAENRYVTAIPVTLLFLVKHLCRRLELRSTLHKPWRRRMR